MRQVAGTSTAAAAIEAAGRNGTGALIGYLPAGYPDSGGSADALLALAHGGVDVIELGIPYSDPGMDGPVIQAATEQSLANGFRVSHVFELVRRVTGETGVPVLVMTYFNPVLRYGVDRFADDLRAAGGAGLITPDLIPDEAGEWIAASDRTGLERVFLAAPTSTDARLDTVITACRGFVYAVSTMGTTGTREGVDQAARTLAGRLKDRGAPLVCVGLGISRPEHVAEVLEYADGAIVGSAFVAALRDGGPAAVERTARTLLEGTGR